jgi:hypothetical protein
MAQNMDIKGEFISHEESKFAEIMRLDGISPLVLASSLDVQENIS